MSLITENDILNEAKDCFLGYASEVLTDRAIPAAEDGLLSAQRKIIWTLEDYLKMNSKSKTKKCQAIVGSTLATSYYHGDAACYGVLCKMSQPYLMRYPLIDGQGSLGTQEDNDLVASSRYTEARPSKYSDLMMKDFKKKVVPLKETYNGEFMEPVVLPSLFPNAICNGRQAIGISMSHTSAPHNLGEVCDAIITYLKQNKSITLDELLDIMPGPDFPLPNTIINKKDIRTAYATGHSAVSLKIRGHYEIKGQNLIFTTIPYRTYRNKIKEQIEKNVDELDKYIDDFDDESALGENKLVFRCKKNVDPEAVAQKLFALTDLQTTLSYNMNFIVDGTPKMCSMIDLIKSYVKHQENIIIKIAEDDKSKAELKKHTTEGLIIILNDIDNAIQIIKNSENRNAAKISLMNHYKLTDVQADAVLDMKLVKLTKLDKDELLNLLKELEAIIAECNKLISDEKYRANHLIEKVREMKNKYADPRRTILTQIDVSEEEKEVAEIIPEDCVVVITRNGMIKRIPSQSFKIQKKNGKGVKNAEDTLLTTISTNTIDTLMLFTDKGKMYRVSINEIPEGTNTGKGSLISSIVSTEQDEKVIAATSLYHKSKAKYVIFITKNGMIKKTALSEYEGGKKKTGIAAIKFKDDDTLANVTFAEEEDFIVITKNGMGIRIESKGISPIGRVSMGVKAIKLNDGDEVLCGLPVHKNSDKLALFTIDGLGKKIALNELYTQGRGGKGIILSKEHLAGALLIDNKDTILINGKPNLICIAAEDIPECSRIAAGNKIIKGSIIESVVKL